MRGLIEAAYIQLPPTLTVTIAYLNKRNLIKLPLLENISFSS